MNPPIHLSISLTKVTHSEDGDRASLQTIHLFPYEV